MALIAAHLNAAVMLVATVTECSDRYIISPFSLSIISLMVSVDVKHHVYLLHGRQAMPVVVYVSYS